MFAKNACFFHPDWLYCVCLEKRFQEVHMRFIGLAAALLFALAAAAGCSSAGKGSEGTLIFPGPSLTESGGSYVPDESGQPAPAVDASAASNASKPSGPEAGGKTSSGPGTAADIVVSIPGGLWDDLKPEDGGGEPGTGGSDPGTGGAGSNPSSASAAGVSSQDEYFPGQW
jgi:hypothetical protein